jgi:NAD(P)H dehydrogenase (quinone)
LKKALFKASAGKSLKVLNETGESDAMHVVMIGDRIRNRADEKQMVILE